MQVPRHDDRRPPQDGAFHHLAAADDEPIPPRLRAIAAAVEEAEAAGIPGDSVLGSGIVLRVAVVEGLRRVDRASVETAR
ncbi:hypothetical protein [Mycobacterium sp. GA-2829]|uniref:hypothetical protein n=1 Tax=Mycobacterium sp. GA-2829 TaxID=1772283 RepID=UPI00073FBF19|nr:hypothetical protein [Mycobacterium sp. GA-2829]KUI32613.1 hypothetical protein AU194_24995 [Mycobacterium sp. GA-2829]